MKRDSDIMVAYPPWKLEFLEKKRKRESKANQVQVPQWKRELLKRIQSKNLRMIEEQQQGDILEEHIPKVSDNIFLTHEKKPARFANLPTVRSLSSESLLSPTPTITIAVDNIIIIEKPDPGTQPSTDSESVPNGDEVKEYPKAGIVHRLMGRFQTGKADVETEKPSVPFSAYQKPAEDIKPQPDTEISSETDNNLVSKTQDFDHSVMQSDMLSPLLMSSAKPFSRQIIADNAERYHPVKIPIRKVTAPTNVKVSHSETTKKSDVISCPPEFADDMSNLHSSAREPAKPTPEKEVLVIQPVPLTQTVPRTNLKNGETLHSSGTQNNAEKPEPRFRAGKPPVPSKRFDPALGKQYRPLRPTFAAKTEQKWASKATRASKTESEDVQPEPTVIQTPVDLEAKSDKNNQWVTQLVKRDEQKESVDVSKHDDQKESLDILRSTKRDDPVENVVLSQSQSFTKCDSRNENSNFSQSTEQDSQIKNLNLSKSTKLDDHIKNCNVPKSTKSDSKTENSFKREVRESFDEASLKSPAAKAANRIMQSSKTFKITPSTRNNVATGKDFVENDQKHEVKPETVTNSETKSKTPPPIPVRRFGPGGSAPTVPAVSEPPSQPPVIPPRTHENKVSNPAPVLNQDQAGQQKNDNGTSNARPKFGGSVNIAPAKATVKQNEQSQPETAVAKSEKTPAPVSAPAKAEPAPARFGTRKSSAGRGKSFTINPRQFSRSSAQPPTETDVSGNSQDVNSTRTIVPGAKTSANSETESGGDQPKTGKRKVTVDQITVIGGYVTLPKSCLAKSKRKKSANISFSEKDLETTYSYVSEKSLLEEDRPAVKTAVKSPGFAKDSTIGKYTPKYLLSMKDPAILDDDIDTSKSTKSESGTDHATPLTDDNASAWSDTTSGATDILF